MPTDPVYNPHLPSASMASTPSHRSSSDTCTTSWSALSVGLIAGAAAGAALALMYAPARGSEVRSSIRRYASDGGQRLSQLIESGRTLAGDTVHRAASLMEQGRNAFRTGTSDSMSASMSSRTPQSYSQPLTASVAEIAGVDRRFEEPLGG